MQHACNQCFASNRDEITPIFAPHLPLEGRPSPSHYYQPPPYHHPHPITPPSRPPPLPAPAPSYHCNRRGIDSHTHGARDRDTYRQIETQQSQSQLSQLSQMHRIPRGHHCNTPINTSPSPSPSHPAHSVLLHRTPAATATQAATYPARLTCYPITTIAMQPTCHHCNLTPHCNHRAPATAPAITCHPTLPHRWHAPPLLSYLLLLLLLRCNRCNRPRLQPRPPTFGSHTLRSPLRELPLLVGVAVLVFVVPSGG